MDSIHQTGAPVKTQVHAAVKFWWAGYDPLQALDLFTAETVPLEAKTTDPTLRQWQPARPGATLEDVRTWMQDQRLRSLRSERLAQRHNDRRQWEGLYLVVIGQEVMA